MAEALAGRSLLAPQECRSWSAACDERSRSSLAALPRSSSSFDSEFYGKRMVTGVRRGIPSMGNRSSSAVRMTLSFKKALKWWEKGIQPNMKEIESADDLVESLLNAGDKFVVVDFFTPGCGGCRALHPKICQFSELNPDVLFLQINYEKHKSMCYNLNVHVLPFFRFYRGAQGRLCSFSCTNSTINKFRNTLAKHITNRCSLGPAKGLEESELLALAANKDLSFNYKRKPGPLHSEVAEKESRKLLVPAAPRITHESEDKAVAAAGR
ncbi:thioredoxin-like 1-2, chloroplastic [Canna indica]|uniref:Thioredoxin-like 1-2, chloroplastic n=1 Tax=Canna indica TaxID=4628 RepID=A0AAQ3QM24_9LILI|nr:thioredoxin-like 1-2, chloroplastic [Canna indica]